MIRFNERIISAVGSLVFGLFILFIYIFKHAVPLTDIYLGNDRTTHVKVVFVAGILGLVCLLFSRKLIKIKWLKFAGYGFSSILMVVLPVLIFITQSGSFRGMEWALKTLIIGIVPLLFIYASVLVFFRDKTACLFIALVLGLFSLYHLLLLFNVFSSIGRAFSSTGSSDIWFVIILILYSTFIAIFSFKYYLKLKK